MCAGRGARARGSMSEAREPLACTVPRCRGRLRLMQREGRSVYACGACAVRLVQLERLQRQAEAREDAVVRRITYEETVAQDAVLLAEVVKRFAPLDAICQEPQTPYNRIRAAIDAKEIPAVQFGRMWVVSRRAADLWRSRVVGEVSARNVAALPRRKEDAVSVSEWAEKVGIDKSNMYPWIERALQRGETRLRRVAIRRRGVVCNGYWWREPHMGGSDE